MGCIQSILCSITFCIERVMTWACCAFVLMLLMFTIILLMVYGISVGYQYAQKELASFAMASRTTTEGSLLRQEGAARAGGGDSDDERRRVVRLVALNRTSYDSAAPVHEIYRTQSPVNVYLTAKYTPVVILETMMSPKPQLSEKEREIARKLISRMRRSENNTTPFFRPLRSLRNLTTVVNATAS